MDLPVILLSAKADDELRVSLLKAGAQDYLIKPFAPEELKVRVKNLYELRRARRYLVDMNAQLEQFNYSVSHDLRAPIRSVKGFGAMLREEYADKLEAGGLTYLEKVLSAATRMERLIDDLLSYSRIWRGELPIEIVDMREALQEAQSQLEATILESKAHLWVEGDFPKVRANRTVLIQVLTNLMSNAIKYVGPGVKPQVRVWAKELDGNVRVYIMDNGIGIKREHMVKIFRPFERLHGAHEYPGTGVGLALVKKGLERMQGAVGLESEPGKGSTFWIQLPGA
jgi:signal transduction histidine kinase